MTALVSPKEREELLPIVMTIICPDCQAPIGAKCTYRNNSRRKGSDYHFNRFYALKKARNQKVSRYGRLPGVNTEDLRPLASRRLTIREERTLGIWQPLKEGR